MTLGYNINKNDLFYLCKNESRIKNNTGFQVTVFPYIFSVMCHRLSHPLSIGSSLYFYFHSQD